MSWERRQNIWTDTWAKIHSCPLALTVSCRPAGTLSPLGQHRPLCVMSPSRVGWRPHSSRAHPRPGKARPPSASTAQARPIAFSAGLCWDSFKRSFLHSLLGLRIWTSDRKGMNNPSIPSTSLTRTEHLLGHTKLMNEKPKQCLRSQSHLLKSSVKVSGRRLGLATSSVAILCQSGHVIAHLKSFNFMIPKELPQLLPSRLQNNIQN